MRLIIKLENKSTFAQTADVGGEGGGGSEAMDAGLLRGDAEVF